MVRDRQTSEGLLEPEVCILPLGGELWNQEPGPGPSLEPWNQFKFGLEPEPGTGFNPVPGSRSTLQWIYIDPARAQDGNSE